MPGHIRTPREESPVAAGTPADQSVTSHGLLVLALGAGYIAVSAGLIAFNKYLIHPDRFPYAVTLVLLHTGFCSTLTAALYLVKPSLFPSLSDPQRKIVVDRELILTGALPIALLFSGQLVLSNTAYLHSSVAFLQMMKEANLVLVYSLSLCAAMERFCWRNARILIFIIAATAMTIHGELRFSWLGFTIQGISQLFESCKIVLQAMLLCNAGRKMDALTYVMLVMPLCFMILGSFMLSLCYFMPHEHFPTPSMAFFISWLPVLMINSCVAFVLNLTVALFVKYSSAVAFILAGVVKDAMIVVTGAIVLRELISMQQVVGFTLQLAAILVYTLAKTFPEKFENGLAAGCLEVLLGRNSWSSESPSKAVVDDKKQVSDYGAALEHGTANTSAAK